MKANHPPINTREADISRENQVTKAMPLLLSDALAPRFETTVERQLNSPHVIWIGFLKTGEEMCTHEHLTFFKMKLSRALN